MKRESNHLHWVFCNCKYIYEKAIATKFIETIPTERVQCLAVNAYSFVDVCALDWVVKLVQYSNRTEMIHACFILCLKMNIIYHVSRRSGMEQIQYSFVVKRIISVCSACNITSAHSRFKVHHITYNYHRCVLWNIVMIQWDAVVFNMKSV